MNRRKGNTRKEFFVKKAGRLEEDNDFDEGMELKIATKKYSNDHAKNCLLLLRFLERKNVQQIASNCLHIISCAWVRPIKMNVQELCGAPKR